MSYDFAGETPEQTIKRAMSILGSRTSPLKARTARENGRKPKKKQRKPAVSIDRARSETK